MTATGLVVSRHRRHLIVRTNDGERLRCIVRGRKLRPLVGDSVEIEHLADGTTAVISVEPRRSTLTRIDARGRPEGVTANVTQLAVVIAAEPATDWMLVDRYFAAAELEGIEGLLVWNKADLEAAAPERAAVYRRAGYELVVTSAREEAGLDALRQALREHRSVLVGQSGVGKSSLINALIGDDVQAVSALSERTSLGKHTTTAADLYTLPGGGELIDTPGVRQYAPYLTEPERLDWAFIEFRPWLGQCRFDDCRHDAEPECAVKRAVAAGDIDSRRYEHYLALRALIEDLSG